MITLRSYASLGSFKNDWLDARYHFSFAEYRDPTRMGLGPLRVVNDDVIGVGGGFAPHPHADMEIITYVREGAITHEDSLGNQGKTAAGDIQVMSAGTGIRHAEYNAEDEAIRGYQIWIQPRHRGNMPRWETRRFPRETKNLLRPLASGLAEHLDDPAVIPIDSDAALYGGVFDEGTVFERVTNGAAYVLFSRGAAMLHGKAVQPGDAIEVTGTERLRLTIKEPSELVWIDLPEA